MGKLETNKQQKLTSLLNTAFNLFTTQGVAKTSIAEISQKAGIAKGTFYLYFMILSSPMLKSNSSFDSAW